MINVISVVIHLIRVIINIQKVCFVKPKKLGMFQIKKNNMSTIVSFFNKTSTRKETRFDLFLNLSDMADCM